MPSSDRVQPKIEDYAIIEAYCDEVPVYAFPFLYFFGGD